MSWLLAIAAWILLGVLIATIAKRLGRGYATYLTISLLLSPIIGVLVLAIAHLSRPLNRVLPKPDTAAVDAEVAEWVRHLKGPASGSGPAAVETTTPMSKFCFKCQLTQSGERTHCQKCGAPL